MAYSQMVMWYSSVFALEESEVVQMSVLASGVEACCYTRVVVPAQHCTQVGVMDPH